MLKTPVVLIIFNRPDRTEQVFNTIRQAQPAKLLVVADGPRSDRPEEAEKCALTRAIIEQVDWECEVLKNYSDVNLGCGVRVSTGLNWVFEQVEEAIVLEDDCLPHPHFFRFCEELLERYRHDNRIMSIAGNQHLLGYNHQLSKYSYYFSRYPLVWGWATWCRAWKHYDFGMKNLPEILEDGWFKGILNNKREVDFWTRNFEEVYDRQYTWDYQWFFACWIQRGLSIHPTVNLVSNIGFGSEATHTKNKNNFWADLPLESLAFPLEHPPFVIPNLPADNYLQEIAFNPSILTRIKVKIRRFLGKNPYESE